MEIRSGMLYLVRIGVVFFVVLHQHQYFVQKTHQVWFKMKVKEGCKQGYFKPELIRLLWINF